MIDAFAAKPSLRTASRLPNLSRAAPISAKEIACLLACGDLRGIARRICSLSTAIAGPRDSQWRAADVAGNGAGAAPFGRHRHGDRRWPNSSRDELGRLRSIPTCGGAQHLGDRPGARC